MLVLKRKEGQWVEITHKSGDKLRVRVFRIREGFPSQLDLAFDDDDRNFEIQRPERKFAPAHPGRCRRVRGRGRGGLVSRGRGLRSVMGTAGGGDINPPPFVFCRVRCADVFRATASDRRRPHGGPYEIQAPTAARPAPAVAGSFSVVRTRATSVQLGKRGQRTHSFQILCGSSAFSTRW